MTDEEFQTLANLYLENAIEPADLERFSQELSASADRVREFNDLRLLMGLIHEHGPLREEAENVVEFPGHQSKAPFRSAPGWLSWRPLTSAVAGIIAGILTTTIVLAYTGPKIPKVSRVEIPLVDPGFEKLDTPLAQPDPIAIATGMWLGDPALLATTGGASVKPKEGDVMVRMRSPEIRRFSNIQQVVEVGRLIPPHGCAMELSVAFFSDGSVRKSRFRLRVRAYAESGRELAASTEHALEFPLVEMRRQFNVPRESTQWTTGKLELDLPPDTQTLVINIHAIDRRNTSAAQYIDDVKAALLITEHPNLWR